MKAALLLLLVTLAAPLNAETDSRPLRAAILAYSVAAAADTGTTLYALGRGGREANPVLAGVASNPAAFVVTKAAATAATAWLFARVHRRHPRAALVLTYASAAALSAVASHNLRVARR